MIHKLDLASLLSVVVGIGSLATDAAFSQQLDAAFGSSAKVIIAVLGLLATVAAQVLRVYSNPSPPSGTVSVVAPKPPAAVAAPFVLVQAPPTVEQQRQVLAPNPPPPEGFTP